MKKIAFSAPGCRSFVVPILNGRLASRQPEMLRVADAEAKGFEIRPWPTVLGDTLTREEVGDLIKREPKRYGVELTVDALVDPKVVAKHERRARLANTSGAERVSYGAIAELADTIPDDETARAFLRGLPVDDYAIALDATTTHEKDNEVKTYHNQPNDALAEQRAFEIRTLGIEQRAAAGNEAAKVQLKSLRHACLVADKTGKPLLAVVKELNLSL